MVEELGQHRVPGLVAGDHPPFGLGERHRRPLQPHDDPVARLVDVAHADLGAARADRPQGGFVHQVGQIGAAHARRCPRDQREVDIGPHLLVPAVDSEDGGPLLEGRERYQHLSVEATGAQQSRIEDVGTVRGRQHDDPFARVEAVHLGQQLVEGLVALVVGRADGGAPPPPDRVDLVDEDDRRGVLASRVEETSHPGCADTDEHLHEVRAGHRDEGNVGLARDCSCDQRLARAGRPDQEHSLRDAGPDLLELRGVAEELDDLPDVGLDRLVAGNVIEVRRRPLRGVHVAGVATERARAGDAGRAAAREPHPQGDDQDDRDHERRQPAEPTPRRGLPGVVPGHVVRLEEAEVGVREGAGRALRGEGRLVHVGALDGAVLGAQAHAGHAVSPHVVEELGVGALRDGRLCRTAVG